MARRARWFLDTLTLITSSGEQNGGGLAIVAQIAPRGPGSPLHVHHREGEWFDLTEGALAVWEGGQRSEA